MTQFFPKPLDEEEKECLATLQHIVESEGTMASQYDKAQQLWRGRKQGKYEAIWKRIEEKLYNATPAKGLCQYCEFDRSTAIEHYYPRKHFPLKAFEWENYLLACFNCNSRYKKDQFAIFQPEKGDQVFELPIRRNFYQRPPNEDAVLINPRTESPELCWQIELDTGVFLPLTESDARKKAKAVYTCNLLHLNTDAALLRYRQQAFTTYSAKLSTYVAVKQAVDWDMLQKSVPIVVLRMGDDVEAERKRIMDKIREDIQDDVFPCVWREMKRQKGRYTWLAHLFEAAPEAENW